eukprot:TRINITY_DN7094_c0_g1_i1.p1 TRINITY_DN7094_c0_g1~~TRINITY_DN7094_c0_g1_i1.p1  ORF type:complete len:252 (-),score=87.55 TRINITY_DN7094_c0_g1_i1:93-848(-)
MRKENIEDLFEREELDLGSKNGHSNKINGSKNHNSNIKNEQYIDLDNDERNKEIRDILESTKSYLKVKQDSKDISVAIPKLSNPWDNEINDGSFIEHVVQLSDTLQGISLKYNIPITEIKNANKLWNPQELYGRKKLLIPNVKDQKSNNKNNDEKVKHFQKVASCEESIAIDYLKKYKNVDIALEKYFYNQKKLDELNNKPKYYDTTSGSPNEDYKLSNPSTIGQLSLNSKQVDVKTKKKLKQIDSDLYSL